jgi:SagB-type dehydrogenase family enzyme
MALSAAQYHRETSYRRDRMSGHSLDWANQPNVYKSYPGIEPIPLSREPGLPGVSLLELFGQNPAAVPRPELKADDLSAILLLTHSLTAKARHPGGDFYYRATASAGALYPTEIYTALTGVQGLEDGLYHFSIARHGLSLLRSGKGPAAFLGDSLEKSARGPCLTFFLTAIFFRSSWKYRDRAWRYHLLDTGHVLEHLILALKALALPYQLAADFDDRSIARLLGLDETLEVPLAVCRVNTEDDSPAFAADSSLPPLPSPFQQASRVAEREADYPLPREAYEAGRLIKTTPPASGDMVLRIGPEPEAWSPLLSFTFPVETMPLDRAVFSRRSRRNYVTTPLSRESWQALWTSLAFFEEKEPCEGWNPHQTLAVGCLAGAVEGIPPGLYLLDWVSKSLGLAASGSFIRPMTGICLDQAWLAQSAVHFLFMGNLRQVDEQWGPRGYRYTLMTAGRLGERLYLTATALGLGCCGIGALYDQEAADLLQLNPDSRLFYLVAVGPVKSRPPA